MVRGWDTVRLHVTPPCPFRSNGSCWPCDLRPGGGGGGWGFTILINPTSGYRVSVGSPTSIRVFAWPVNTEKLECYLKKQNLSKSNIQYEH